ncbi:MAG: DNA-formamidopyrimidine glycosylase family protein [Roseicyclus sp.]
MPELPEVETVRRGLAPVLEGAVIARAEVNRPDLRWPLPERMAGRLAGARVLRLRRRSKYILADLDTGETLIVHLGMSGRMIVSQGGGRSAPGLFHHAHPAPGKHDHVVLDTEAGARITFNDARRFGAAAAVLKQRGYSSVRLLTNNPEKEQAVRNIGIRIENRENLVVGVKPENLRYLATKIEKFGHTLEGVHL